MEILDETEGKQKEIRGNLSVTSHKVSRLFMILGGFFLANALIAEFIGVKIFALEQTLGFDPLRWDILGEERSMELTAGVLLWPVVFIMTDIINEYFGRRGVKFLSYGTVALISYAFFMVFLSIELTPPDWWVNWKQGSGVPEMQDAYSNVFGQSLWIIVGSLVAFLVGQLADVFVFHRIKKVTGEQKIWLRATGSTLVSQLIDSFVVLYIAFGIGSDWSMVKILSIGFMNYTYKFIVAIALTPVLYWVHGIIDRYLGEELAQELKEKAMEKR
ncbi:MAG: queuosine precursor transporter [Saprospiraceae bacterium]|nr:queuosine precursor transporter [Saprospiraceae bacterium]